MSINEIQDEIIEDFELFDNWEDRYAYIIELGKKLSKIEEKYKVEENKIKGCQSNVWVYTELEAGNIIFKGDSDALIVKGLVSLLIKVMSGQSPKAVTEADLYFIDKIGMKQHLSMNRSNGLVSMIKQMKLYGVAYQAS